MSYHGWCWPWDLAWRACCIGLDIPESVRFTHHGACGCGWLAAQSDIEPRGELHGKQSNHGVCPVPLRRIGNAGLVCYDEQL
jgi:hypothetical protein